MVARASLFLALLGGVALAESSGPLLLRGIGVAVILLAGVPFALWLLIDFVQVWIVRRRRYWD